MFDAWRDWAGMMETELFAQNYKNLRSGDRAPSRLAVHGNGRAVRERAGILVARVGGGKTTDFFALGPYWALPPTDPAKVASFIAESRVLTGKLAITA